MTRNDLVYEFNDDMWLMYHDGTINNQDDFYDQFHDWIDNKVIYTHESKKICDALDYDIFEEHDIYGKAENWSQAAYCALYDLLMDHDDTLTYDEMVKETENA